MVDEAASHPPDLLPAASTGPAPASLPDPPPGQAGESTPPEPEDRPLDPEKLLRLAGLVRAVLDEVRQIDPDQATTAELSALHRRVTAQVEDALPNALRDELEAIDLAPGGDGAGPNKADGSGEAASGTSGATGATAGTGATGQEMRFAYAGLIGWLSGLFQGLQAAMQFQQMQAMNALPGGGGPGGGGNSDGREGRGSDIEPGTGHYL